MADISHNSFPAMTLQNSIERKTEMTSPRSSPPGIINNSNNNAVTLSSIQNNINAKCPGTLIPNRIFVGGLPTNTTEQELKTYFSSFGAVKDAKIIHDRSGMSKGVYGFVTFENQEVAENIIKTKSESLMFKERKLNIGQAVRKQQTFPRTDMPGTVFLMNGSMPLTFQNGLAMVPINQDYLMSQNTYSAPMVVPQPVYLPQTQYYQAAMPSAINAAPVSNNPMGANNNAIDQWQASLTNNNAMCTASVGNGTLSTNMLNPVSTPNNYVAATQQQGWRWAANSTPQNQPNGSAYVYSTYPNTANDIMYVQHNGSALAHNSASDFSTDASNHSMFETSESDISPKRNMVPDMMNVSNEFMQMQQNGNRVFMPSGFYGHQLISQPGLSNKNTSMVPRGFQSLIPSSPMINKFSKPAIIKESA